MLKFPDKLQSNKWRMAGFAAVIFFLAAAIQPALAQTASLRQIDILAYVSGSDDSELENGEYPVRFAIYAVDRKSADAYPSNSDSRIWEESQNVEINNGILNAYLGSSTPLPESLDFSSGNYYLGIRIGADSEMVPRKRIGAIPLAINALSVQGAVLGEEEGDILQLGKGGKIDEKMLPDAITSDYIDSELSGKTYDGLTLTANADGFSIEGGDTARQLTLTGGDITLNAPGAAGSVMYSDGSAYSFTAQGSSGQVLLSSGSGTPTWGTVTGGAGGIITSDSLDFTELSDSMALDGDTTIDTGGFTFDITGTLQADSIIISGEATIGTLGLNLYTNTSFIPSTDGLNLGSSDHHWSNLYADNLSIGTLEVESSNLSGTSGEYFTINTDSISDEDMGLRFYRSTLNGYAALAWDASDSLFNLFKRENTAELANLNLAGLNLSGNLNLNGNTLYGNDTSGGNLTLQSTSDATKGKIIFGTSAYDEVNNRLGLGTATPGAELEVVGDIISTGTQWTARSAAEANQWLGVAYGNGTFVAVSYDGTNRVMTSSDGINWTARSAAGNNDSWLDVTFGNGLFVAVGNGTEDHVMTSPDGINWTARSAAGNDDDWMGVAYGNNLFVAVASGVNGPDRIMTSPDGINWTVRSAAGNNDRWTSVTYGNGLFVAVSYESPDGNDNVITSSDGINWTVQDNAGASNDWFSVTYGNGLFVAVRDGGVGNRVMTSPDGINWTARSAAGNDDLWQSVAYGDGLFVAVGHVVGDRVMTSPDGINWTVRSAAGNNDDWEFVTYGNGLFVAVGGSGDRVMTSGKPDFNQVPTNNIYQGGMNIFGNVGIGTTSPTSQFELKSSVAAGATVMAINADDGEGIFLVEKDASDNGSITVKDGSNANQAYLNSAGNSYVQRTSGNFGIGTIAPTTLLDIERAGTAKANTDYLEITNSANAADMDATLSSILFNQWYYDASTPAVADAGKITVGTETDWTSTASTQDSYLAFQTALDGTVAEKMRVTSAGYLGIGTVSPSSLLDVEGTSTSNAWIQIRNSGASGRAWDLGEKDPGFFSIGSDMSLKALNINGTTGAVGIGDTSPAYGSLVAASGVVIGSDADQNALIDDATNGSGSTTLYIGQNTIDTTAPSDAQLKRNIEDTGLTLSQLMQLNVVDFQYIPEFTTDSSIHHGLIAQEVEKIYPYAVSVRSDGYKMVDYGSFTPLLIRSMQEQQSAIEEISDSEFLIADQISQITLKTDGNITTLQQLKTSVDEELKIVEGQLAGYGSQLAGWGSKAAADGLRLDDHEARIQAQEDLTGIIQAQIAQLHLKLDTETNLAQIDLNVQDVQFIKLLLGTDRVANPEDVDILGRLSAKTLESGGIEISILDPDAPTIGEGAIPQGESLVFIETKAADADSKIYITPIGSTDNQVIYIDSVDEAAGFKVKVDRIKEILPDGTESILHPDEIRFNWWIVRSKNIAI